MCASRSSPARPTRRSATPWSQRYGNVILFRPPFKPSTAWVWLAPFLLLLVGVFVAVRIVRQRASMVASDDSVVDTDETAR